MRSHAALLTIACGAALAACSEGGPSGMQDLGAADHTPPPADLAGADHTPIPDMSGGDMAKPADALFDGFPGDAAPDGFTPDDGFFPPGDGGPDGSFPDDGFFPPFDGGPAPDANPPPFDGGPGDGSFPRCPMMMGFVGPNGMCGGGGNCNGNVYQLVCNGTTCVCSVDNFQTQSFIEMNGTCNNIMVAWSQACGF